MNRLLTIAVVTLLLAGCSGPQYWESRIVGTVEQGDGHYRFDGQVELAGKAGDVTIHGIHVIFLDKEGETLKVISVGQLGQTRGTAHLSTILPDRPKLILLKAERIDAPSGSEYALIGLRRGEDGFYDEYTDYDPIIRNSTSTLGNTPSGPN